MIESTWVCATETVPIRNLHPMMDLFDLFNGGGSGKAIRLVSLKISPRSKASYLSDNFAIDVWRTAASGIGGLPQVIISHDSSQPELPAEITARVNGDVVVESVSTKLLISSTYNDDVQATNPVEHIVYQHGRSIGKPVTIYPGEGLLIRHAVSHGLLAHVSIEAIFTVLPESDPPS